MSGPQGPCETCGQPHQWTRHRGYTHADGHPYKPQADTTTALERVTREPTFAPLFFGLLAECPRCAAVVDNQRAAIHTHRNHCWNQETLT